VGEWTEIEGDRDARGSGGRDEGGSGSMSRARAEALDAVVLVEETSAEYALDLVEQSRTGPETGGRLLLR
jgi:hypothetical protein